MTIAVSYHLMLRNASVIIWLWNLLGKVAEASQISHPLQRGFYFWKFSFVDPFGSGLMESWWLTYNLWFDNECRQHDNKKWKIKHQKAIPFIKQNCNYLRESCAMNTQCNGKNNKVKQLKLDEHGDENCEAHHRSPKLIIRLLFSANVFWGK